MKRRRWYRYLRRRRWYRYLRATATRAWAAVGPKRTIMGLLAAVAGGVLNVDLGFAVTVLILILFLIQWFVFTPADMWDEARRDQDRDDQAGSQGIYVASGATYIEHNYTSGTAGTATQTRRRPRPKREEKPRQPPLPGF